MGKGSSMQVALQAAGYPASLVTPSMAAEIIGYHVHTIREWVRTGRIKAWGTQWGNRYFVDLAEILAPVAPDRAKLAPIISRDEWRKRRAKGSAVNATIARKRAALNRSASAIVPSSDSTPEA